MDDNQQSLDGSGDSIGKKQRKFDLEHVQVSEIVDCEVIQKIDAIPANTPEATDYITQNKSKIQSFLPQTAAAVKATVEHLRERREELESWIKQSFEVDDLEQQIYLLNAKRRFSEIDDQQPQPPPTKGKEEKPKLRLKLSAAETATPPDHQSANNNTGGRGAKNLGRMSRSDPQQQPDLKPKVPNQVPITTFWNFVEPFFKRIDENDVKYLDDPNRIIDPTPFMIPGLGRHYLEQWREQYGYVTSSMGIRPLPGPSVCSLKDRLLSMLVPLSDDTIDATDIDATDDSTPEPQPPATTTTTNATLDHRLRRELADAGFLSLPLSSKDHQEDDELCQELRRLQNKLRECTMLNQYRKRRLADHVRRLVLPCQELYHLIDEIDKQLCSLYLKAQRSRKKGAIAAAKKSTPHDNAAEVHRLIANRTRLLEAFAGEVGPRALYLRGAQEQGAARLFEQSVESRLRQDAKQLGLWFLDP